MYGIDTKFNELTHKLYNKILIFKRVWDFILNVIFCQGENGKLIVHNINDQIQSIHVSPKIVMNLNLNIQISICSTFFNFKKALDGWVYLRYACVDK